MRLPFLQIPQLDMSRGRTLARILRIPEAHGIGLTVALDAWAVEEAPEGDVSGLIRDEHPAEAVALAVGWDGDSGALLAALVRVRLVESTADGFRVASVRRYESALTAPARRSESGRVAATERWGGKKDANRMAAASPPQCDSMRSDAYTQTQTQKEASASQEPEPVPEGKPFALELQKPEKRPRKQSGQERVYGLMRQARIDKCAEVGEPFVEDGWPATRINRDLGQVARDTPEAKDLFSRAWALYLADDGNRVRKPAWSIAFFMSSGVRARYETDAARLEEP
jgi:hypothetical protein